MVVNEARGLFAQHGCAGSSRVWILQAAGLLDGFELVWHFLTCLIYVVLLGWNHK